MGYDVNINVLEIKRPGLRAVLVGQNIAQQLEKKVKEKGFTIVPHKLYISDRGFAKVEIALAQGKKSYDKRESIKQKDMKRDLDRMKRSRY